MSATKEDLFGIEKDEESEYDSEEIEEQGKGFSRSKINRAGSDDESEVESEVEDGDEDGNVTAESGDSDQEELGGANEDSEADSEEEKDERFASFDQSPEPPKKSGKKKVKPLTPEELEKFQKDINKTGVVYLARIPPFMKPVKIKQLLSRYAEIGRVYLAPEDAKITARRKKYAKNNKQNFTEGWVEFKDKKKAKAVAAMLNTQQIGGKKKSYYYYDLWNIKYLPKFKWHHLTEQMAYESKARQQRLSAEIAQATRENKTFISNVEKSKMINKMEENKKRKAVDSQSESPSKFQRNFDQRSIVRREADLTAERKTDTLANVQPKMKNVLGKVFGGK
ncbi:hypothetical protein K450DRAFT_301481 [Umbelopsis ramanniana AG]|uniref:18S rRNA factor 2 n=1 Tax=Umbelopsis ramanniana AG TaxID=1314678 RepID=A0AAD5HD99_UMBRA|nr:uncharacterized protein K450DRAFT_301481 [Umbelopsis ramanniana AG]KAI8577968.1 hypothetical protein K450DRAFT_301481 [Umbelopsis ramanniana AG]